MATATPADLIALCLKDVGVVGVGQTPLAEDENDAFDTMNLMLAQWQRKRWLVYHLVTTAFTSTGAQSYTVGPTGNYVLSPRPDRLEAAFFRQLNVTPAVDYPLEIIEAREDYNAISLKTLTAFPQYIFYDSDFPTGYIYPWPLPQASLYAVHITTKAVLTQFTSLAQSISLPAEYKAALRYNLDVRLRPAYQLPPDPTLTALARDSLNVIRGANAQIPRLHMPDDLVRAGTYNIYSDTT